MKKRRLGAALLAGFAFGTLALSGGAEGVVVASEHIFTWRGYDGTRGSEYDAEWFFDGTPYGKGGGSLGRMRDSLRLEKGDKVKILLPDEFDIFRKGAVLPFRHSGILNRWLDLGVAFEFYHGDSVIKSTKISWRNYNGAGDEEQAIIVIDGKEAGKADTAEAALNALSVGQRQLVLVIVPCQLPPMGKERFAHKRLQRVVARWRGDGVRVFEFLDLFFPGTTP